MHARGLLVLILSLAPAFGAALEVDSGSLLRTNAVVEFAWTAGAPGKALRDGSKTLPIQFADGRGAVIIPRLNSGKQTFEIVNGPANAQPAATAKKGEKAVALQTHGREALSYYFAESDFPRANIRPIFKRGGYIHPAQTWSGKTVTDDYPANHVHHHGLWAAWTKTEFEGRAPDFWNMGDGKGTIKPVALEKHWSGPAHSGFVAQHQYVDLTSGSPKPALNETWTVHLYASASDAKPYHIFDLETTQNAASNVPLKLPEYHYGGIGMRGRWEWNGRTNVNFLTSERVTDRVQGNSSRGRWCAMSGAVNGGEAGIAILGHPSNFRAPEPMRLHPTEPFFCYAPSQLGDWEIAPGKTYTAKYRFVTFDGPADYAVLDRLWKEFAEPPVSTVK